MTTATAERTAFPVLLGLKEIAALLPVAEWTVYRWRLPRDGRPPILPEPFLTLSGTPLWTEEQILDLAAERKLTPRRAALTAIRKEQAKSRSAVT